MTKQKEPITQNIRNRREHSSRFKVMFYVIGSEKSKSGFCFLQLPPTEPKAWWSSSVLPVYRYRVRQIRLSQNMFEHSYSVFMCGQTSTTSLYKQRHRLSMFGIVIATFLWTGAAALFAVAPLITIQRRRANLSTAGEARSSRPLTWVLGFAM